jgi:FAD/FMN-containing dehydrogenase
VSRIPSSSHGSSTQGALSRTQPNARALASLLRSRIAGDVLDDDAALGVCSRDASPYARRPSVVVRPRDRDDVATLLMLAAPRGIAVVPRAGGTSLAGQCVPVGDSIVVDVGTHMARVTAVDVDRRQVTVQPGVVRDALNRHLAPNRLLFAPDPSTTDRCQIGGMIGNNAWGLHAVSRGTTRDHVVELEIVTSAGAVHRLQGIVAPFPAKALSRDDERARLHAVTIDVLQRYAAAIERGYPSLRGVTSNAGYPLDVLYRQHSHESARPFNLAPLMCGAEGTLAIVTEATLGLIEVPGVVRLCCLHFDGVDAALQAVATIRETGPSALEMVDRAILRVASTDPAQQRNRFWLLGDPAAVLLVEYAGHDGEDVERRARGLCEAFRGRASLIADDGAIERVWALRRASLGMLMGAEGGLQAVTGIEDAAVAPRDLPGFYREVRALLDAEGLEHFAYGPVGMGSLHIRPVLPLHTTADLARYERLLDGVAAIAVRLGGTFTCKHGDGRMRGRYLDSVLGPDVVAAMREVKRAFDPLGILNPGKILDCPAFATDLLIAGA